MGDRHPLTSSEHFVLMDVGDSRTDLNMASETEDQLDERKSGIFSQYNFNGKLATAVFSLICFIFALIFFISSVVVHYNRSVEPQEGGCNFDTFRLPVHEHKVNEGSKGPFNEKSTVQTSDSGTGDDRVTAFREWSVTKVNGKHVKPGVLVFEENFNKFNTSTWDHIIDDSGSQFFYYVNNRSNSYVKDGILFLKPTFTSDATSEDYIYNGTLFLGRLHSSEKCKNASALCWKNSAGILHPVMTPMINSQESFNFLYGRLEIRAKMPAGDWIEPLITLQPNQSIYGEGLVSGQVQVIDIRGNRKLFNAEGVNVGSEQNCPDIRFGTHKDKKIIYDCLSTDHDEGFDTKFSIYEIIWTPESITLKIDGEGIVTAPNPRPSMYKMWSKGRRVTRNPWANAENKVMAPFDSSFYIAMGINVGGTVGFFSDEYQSPYPKPWRNDDPHAPKTFWEHRHDWEPSWRGNSSSLQIDYIRLYSLNVTTTSD